MSSQSKVSKKKPHVFYEITAVWQSRTSSSNEDSHMQLLCEENTDYHFNAKPLHNVKFKFLEDRIEFKSTSLFGSRLPRNEMVYAKIERCVSFEDRQIVCMITDEGDGEKVCEMFRFKNRTQTREIQDLVNKARQHPQYKLVDPNAGYLSGSITSLNDAEGNDSIKNSKYKSLEDVSISEMVETSKGSVSTLPKRQNDAHRPALPMVNFQNNSFIEEPEIRANKDYLKRSSAPNTADNLSESYTSKPTTEVMYIKGENNSNSTHWHPQDVETLRNDLMKNVDKDAWSAEIQCIENHPKHGNRLSVNGSIYMFIAHMNPEQKNYSVCSSSNASLHSINEDSAKKIRTN